MKRAFPVMAVLFCCMIFYMTGCGSSEKSDSGAKEEKTVKKQEQQNEKEEKESEKEPEILQFVDVYGQQYSVEINQNIAKKQVQKKMFPGYVLINMVMNDDTWYVVRNTRGVTGFVGPGSKPVPLTEAEMRPLGIKEEKVVVDFKEGDTVTIIGGVWKDTVGVIQSMNESKQIVTINVELFGRETPVEISFAEVKKM